MLVISALVAGSAPSSIEDEPEVVSLLGWKFYAQADEKATLEAARKKLEADPKNADNMKATDLEIATLGYGVGNWHLYNGNRERAREIFHRIIAGKYWPAFGFIAAEAELARDNR